MRRVVCFGWSWRSLVCLLDVVTLCKLRPVCDLHDRYIMRTSL